MQLAALLNEVRSCRLCESYLPDGVRPIVQVDAQARVLIVGQAPGRKVHESGVPFDDSSGDRLRGWMGVSKEVFYDPKQTAILPMGFCYPGKGKFGDLPPLPECAPAWRDALLAHLPNIELTLLVGQYVQTYDLGSGAHSDPGAKQISLTQRVQAWASYWPEVVPLPHPSPRNNIWLKRNPWFEQELIPVLQKRVAEVVQGQVP